MHVASHRPRPSTLIDTLEWKLGKTDVIGEGASSQNDVSIPEAGPQATKEANIVPMKVLPGDGKNRAAGQRQECGHLHHRETTARFLSAGLGKAALVGLGVGELNVGRRPGGECGGLVVRVAAWW